MAETSQIQINRFQHIEIAIGNTMQIQAKGAKDYVLGSMAGGKKGYYLIVETQPSPGFLNRLGKENQIIVRTVQGGIVYGFHCTLIRSLDKPFHLSFFSYPDKIEAVNLRVHERVACFLPARLETIRSMRQGTILDLSEGGCSFVYYHRPADDSDREMERGEEVRILLQIAGEKEIFPIQAVIKRIQKDDRKTNIGVKFAEVDSLAADRIRAYVGKISGMKFDIGF